MCQFTRIVWYCCGHDRISTTPEHTLLCNTGVFKLRQGISRAPASCHPLPDDLLSAQMGYTSIKIAQTNYLFDFCDDCKSSPQLAADFQTVGTPVIAPVEAPGDYSDEVEKELAVLRDQCLTNSQQCEAVMQSLEAALSARLENKFAVENIRTHWIRNILLQPDSKRYHNIVGRSLSEIGNLLDVLDLYFNQRVPMALFSELYAFTRNKLYQVIARREIVRQLTERLQSYITDPVAYEAALEHNASQLAVRLGQIDTPDAGAYAYLSRESPLHAQHTAAVKERVRRHEIKSRAIVLKGKYVPRASFGSVRNRNILSVDTQMAKKPPPGTKDIPELRDIKDILIVYEKWSEVRQVLSPLGIGQGPWGIRSVLEQEEGPQDKGEDYSIGLQIEQEQTDEQPEAQGRSLPQSVSYMGQALSDTDSEVSGDDIVNVNDETDESERDRHDLAPSAKKTIRKRSEDNQKTK